MHRARVSTVNAESAALEKLLARGYSRTSFHVHASDTMAEPQPPNVHEGADPPDVLPANAEDRKAAQALSSLDASGDNDGSTSRKELDLKALNDAMKHLTTRQQDNSKSLAAVKKEEPKKLVKVDAADVALLVRIQLLHLAQRLTATG